MGELLKLSQPITKYLIRMKRILLIMILFTSCDYGVIKQSDLKVELERAYFEGQRYYANGDKRIQWTKDSCWVWVKSPWDGGSQPIFNPSIIHSKNE